MPEPAPPAGPSAAPAEAGRDRTADDRARDLRAALDALSCGVCGGRGVRIYRPYGNFYRPEDNRCNAHITVEQRGWYVPCVPDADGSIWGYTSIPPDAVAAWDALPEANPALPSPNV